MSSNRIWTIGALLVMVAVMVLGWLVAIQPQLSAAGDAAAQQAAAAATNAQQEQKLAALKKDFAKIDELQATLANLSQSVPSGTEIPAFVTQLNALAAATGVQIVAISVDDAQAYAPVAPPAPAATPAADTTATPAPTPAAEPTATPGAPPVTNALLTPTNFASLAIEVRVSGPYPSVLEFVHGLQSGTRLMLVNGFNSKASTSTEGSVDASVSGLIYSLVDAAATPSTAQTTGDGETQAQG